MDEVSQLQLKALKTIRELLVVLESILQWLFLRPFFSSKVIYYQSDIRVQGLYVKVKQTVAH